MSDQPKPSKTGAPKRAKKISPATRQVAAGPDIFIRPGQDAAGGVERFDNFISWTLQKGVTELSPPQLVIAAVLTQEGLVTEKDLPDCLSALPKVVRRGDAVHVAWSTSEVVRRCSLSAITIAAFKLMPIEQLVHWPTELKKFSETLRNFYPGAKDLRGPDRLTSVLRDASSWLYLNCPLVIFGYLMGQLRLSLLSDLAHDRRIGAIAKQPAEPKEITVDDPLLAEAKDAALELAFDDGNPASQSRWIVDALKKLVSVGGGQDSVRSAEYLARGEVRRRLQDVVITLTRVGTPVDGLLLAWVIHLFESGSVRLKNPKTSTITRYVIAATERLHGALSRLGVVPAETNQEQWQDLFKGLLAAEDVSNELRCSLASFHCYLMSEFGVEPMPWLFAGVEEVSLAKATVVWPHELMLASERIGRTVPDERLEQQMQVLLAIGANSKVRIGELRSLQMRSVQVQGSDAWIEIAPKRSHHQGKSSAARRIIKLSDSAAIKVVKSWVDRREAESAEPDELLFANPLDPQKCYRMGAGQRLLNQMLRSVTGDADVSFHSLRHSVISRELLTALMEADVHHAISPIHQTAVQAGHRHESTTFINYFHLPEEVVRHWIDRAMARYLDSPVTASKWLGRSADSLRQARLRSADKAKFLPKEVRGHALSLVQQPVTVVNIPQYELVPSPLSVTETGGVSISMPVVLSVMNGLKFDRSVPGICSTSGMSEDNLAHICRSVAHVDRQIEGRSQRNRAGLSQKANNQACFDFARASLKRLEFCFNPIVEPFLKDLAQQLEGANASAEKATGAARAWAGVLSGSVLSLMDADTIEPLIELIYAANIGPENMVVRVQLSDRSDPNEQAGGHKGGVELEAARSMFDAVYAAYPQIESVKSRRGCPEVYLVISRVRTGAGRAVASASARMTHFNGLMFSAAVRHNFLASEPATGGL